MKTTKTAVDFVDKTVSLVKYTIQWSAEKKDYNMFRLVHGLYVILARVFVLQ